LSKTYHPFNENVVIDQVISAKYAQVAEVAKSVLGGGGGSVGSLPNLSIFGSLYDGTRSQTITPTTFFSSLGDK